MASAAQGCWDEFDEYTQDELALIIEEIEKYERDEVEKESDVDIWGDEAGDDDTSDPDDDIWHWWHWWHCETLV